MSNSDVTNDYYHIYWVESAEKPDGKKLKKEKCLSVSVGKGTIFRVKILKSVLVELVVWQISFDLLRERLKKFGQLICKLMLDWQQEKKKAHSSTSKQNSYLWDGGYIYILESIWRIYFHPSELQLFLIPVNLFFSGI